MKKRTPNLLFLAFIFILVGALFSWHTLSRTDMSTAEITIAVCEINIAAMLCVILFAVLGYLRSRKALQKNRAELRRQEECFRIVASQVGRYIFRYDIPTKTYSHITGNHGPFYISDDIINLSEQMIKKGIVTQESAALYKDFFYRIEHGIQPPDTDIRMKERTGSYGWYRFSATFIRTPEGNPVTAIISYMECSEQRELELAYSRWIQEKEAITDPNTVLLEWNISRNIFEGEHGDARLSPANHPTATFDEVARLYADQFVCEQDKTTYLSLINRERLLGMYHSGNVNCSIDYREKRDDGTKHWMRLIVRLVMYPFSTDINVNMISRDIDEVKQQELTLIEQSEKDSLTGVYNRRVFTQKTRELLRAKSEGNQMLLIVDVDEFKCVNDSFGHDSGDKLLIHIANAAKAILRSDDLIGRLGGDEFLICIPNMLSEEARKRKAAELLQSLTSSDFEKTVTVSIGAAVSPKDGTTFEELYIKADTALYHIKNSGKNNYIFYSPEMNTETRCRGIIHE